MLTAAAKENEKFNPNVSIGLDFLKFHHQLEAAKVEGKKTLIFQTEF